MDKCEIKKSLVTEIYCSLKDDILWLRLKPGQMLNEQYLAEIYKTSKTPVREALARLIAENLVTVLPRKGYIVTNISYSDMHNLFQYRSVLECASIEYAVKYATDVQLNHLEELSGNLKAFYDDEPHFEFSIFSNTDFHLYLTQISGNPFILDALVKAIEQMQRFMWASTTESILEASVFEHYQIVKLIREKQVIEAQKLMRKHINDVFESGMERKVKGFLSHIVY